MIVSRDLFQVGVLGCFFTVRWYRETSWGTRCLGGRRYALDLGHISFLAEKY